QCISPADASLAIADTGRGSVAMRGSHRNARASVSAPQTPPVLRPLLQTSRPDPAGTRPCPARSNGRLPAAQSPAHHLGTLHAELHHHRVSYYPSSPRQIIQGQAACLQVHIQSVQRNACWQIFQRVPCSCARQQAIDCFLYQQQCLTCVDRAQAARKSGLSVGRVSENMQHDRLRLLGSERQNLVVMFNEGSNFRVVQDPGVQHAAICLYSTVAQRMLADQHILNTIQRKCLQVGREGFLGNLRGILPLDQLKYAVIHEQNAAGEPKSRGLEGYVRGFAGMGTGRRVTADYQEALHDQVPNVTARSADCRASPHWPSPESSHGPAVLAAG